MMSVTLATAAPLKRWVGWRNQRRAGRIAKVPYAPCTGHMAKANDPAGWARRDEAESWARVHVNGVGGGVGLQLGPAEGEDYGFGGIDLDSCRDPTTGNIEVWAREIIERLGSYTEVSPSNTGLKVFFRYRIADTVELRSTMGTNHTRRFVRGGGEHPPAVELHISNRYFTVTDRPLEGISAELGLVELPTLTWLAAEAGPAFVRNGEKRIKPRRPVPVEAVGSASAEPDEKLDALTLHGRLRVVMKRSRTLAARWKGSTAGLKDQTRSGMDMSMVALLKLNQFSYEDAKALLLHWPNGAGAEHVDDDRYFRRMWDRSAAGSEEAAACGNMTPVRMAPGHSKLAALSIGSDAEIARYVTQDLESRYGPIVFTEGEFWHYGGTHWEPLSRETLWLAAARYDGAHFSSSGRRSTVRLGKPRVESILACMRPALTRQDFFADPVTGINCVSGFIRFSEAGVPALEQHSPDHRCRHVLAGRWPCATTIYQDRQSLLATLLNGCFKDEEDKAQKIEFLGEVAGVAALGAATRLTNPKAVVLYGEQAENGKSKLLDAIRALLPREAVSSVSPMRFGDRTFVCHLAAKLLNATDELTSASAIASEVFKQVITGEPLMVRDVYRSAFDFRPVAQHVFSTNTLPEFKDGMDRGVRRRLIGRP